MARIVCALLATFVALPAAATEVKVQKDVPYLGSERAEKADLYLPADDGTSDLRPAVVIIHGGGWTAGDKGAKREINIGTTLAAHGYVGLSINYVLQTTDGPPVWPRNLHDCKTAVRWMRANAKRLRIDPKHIGVIGGSAGGHLAALVGVTDPKSGLDPAAPFGDYSCRVQAVVDLYGPMADDTTRPVRIIGKSRDMAPKAYEQVTPLSHLDPNDPPVLILHGTADTTVPAADSKRFAAALKSAGVVHELIIIPGAPHTFDLQPKQKDLRPVVLAFFDKYLKPGVGK